MYRELIPFAVQQKLTQHGNAAVPTQIHFKSILISPLCYRVTRVINKAAVCLWAGFCTLFFSISSVSSPQGNTRLELL